MLVDHVDKVSCASFNQTVPKEYVHKYALDEVFITSWAHVGDQMILGAVLPRAHSLYCEFPAEDRSPDIALITEVCRQSCFVVAHTKFEIPVQGNRFQFLLEELEVELVEVSSLPSKRPIELLVECSIEEMKRRGSEVSSLVWVFTVWDREGKVRVAKSRMKMVWIDRLDWHRMHTHMRNGRDLNTTIEARSVLPSEVSPKDVGRQNRDNVALQSVTSSEGEFQAIARVDTRHPVLFDHPIDHVYAMVQLEVSRQLAIYIDAKMRNVSPEELEVFAFKAKFTSVAELDLPLALCEEKPDLLTGERDAMVHHILFQQGGRTVSKCQLSTRMQLR
ncbi:AfsA-related hotdog domain-containing protein [Paenibacillus sp. PL2-23]|uniref:AfsA-related hotdog domain-containing protein n=1 Tax=Paenibacillus sp. PL2-23 TaxID=2100729 RepID=UPI0030FA538E